VLSVNLSKNLLKNVDDVVLFNKLLILDITKNEIQDIFFVEELPSLNIFYAEYNKISSISSLVKCKNLEKLFIAHNTIKYQMSSLKTLNSLQKLSELTIVNNTVNFII
jgi:Leucine-rich repeat (LRR) protein